MPDGWAFAIFRQLLQLPVCLDVPHIALGFYILQAIRQPAKQFMAVDTLIILLGSQALVLISVAGKTSLMEFEWFIFIANTGLITAMLFFRTRGSEVKKIARLKELAAEIKNTPKTERTEKPLSLKTEQAPQPVQASAPV